MKTRGIRATVAVAIIIIIALAVAGGYFVLFGGEEAGEGESGGEEGEQPPAGEEEQPTREENVNQLNRVEETEYWVAYEPPSQTAFSLAWGDGHLWMSDFFSGMVYELEETDQGLNIVSREDAKQVIGTHFEARDLTWDGNHLWSVGWGDLIQHSENISMDQWIHQNEREPPHETMHHLEGVGWDGNTLWTALDGTLNRHDEESYEVEAVYPMGAQPAAIAFRGQELWVADKIWGKIYHLDTSSLPEQGYPTEDGYIFDITAEVPDEADPPVLNTYSIVEKPYALTWSNDNLWVYDLATKRVYKIKKLPETSLDPEDEYLEEGQEFTISEEVSGNVTWTQENSPYVIEYGFEVPENSTLNIEPGVTILLKQGDFMVRGVLQAVGTSDQPIVFSHKDEEDIAWGNFIFEGREAGESTLRHVRIQYQDINGVMAINAAPTIEYSAIRHGGGLSYDLETGEYGTIMVRGNRFNEASVGVSVSAKATVDQIVVRGNTFRYGPAEFLGVDVENGPTPVVVEHNIVEDFKRAATNFNGNLNLTFRHNLVRNVISYRGIAPAIEGKSNIRYNYFEYVDPPIQTAYRDLENASILYNTMKYPYDPFESNFNKSGVQVEYNNFIPYPKMEIWAISIDEIDVDTWGGFSAEMPHNWWGTSDRSVIDEHIYDSKDTESRGPLIIEPILEEPNGIGFIQGTVINSTTGEPIPKATVQVSDASLLTAVTGEFFTALPEGGQRVRVSAAGYRSNEVVVNVTAAESESVVIRLVSESGS